VQTRKIDIGGVKVGGGMPLALIGGPCVIEGEKETLEHARLVKDAADKAGIPLIFKASFDKANRSSVTSFRGVGLEEGLRILKLVKNEFRVPVLTDIHEPEQCERAAEVVDILQIPAFLCRQTDLLIAAGKTGKPVNVKKGQFLAPGDMRNVVDKIKATDNEDILLTERGTMFGYNYLINDMRSLPSMRKMGYPVVFDATHSVQRPGGLGNRSGGDRQFVAPLARAAVACGVDAIFLELHPNPDAAPSDGPNMLNVREVSSLLKLLKTLDDEVRAYVLGEQFESSAAFHMPTGGTFVKTPTKSE
jgi:2-dehydro-3-deoxyphosphooctonate aldolase (KDO 8-P synthase)